MQSLFANVMACISFFPLFFFSPLLLFLFPSAKPLSHNKKASHSFALLFSPLRKKKVSLSQFHCSESPFASPISTKPLADMATSDPMAPSRSSSPLLASVHQHYTSEASTQSKTSTAATGHHKKKLAGQKRTPARTIGTQTEPHGYYQPRAKVLKISSSSRRPIKTDIVHDSRSCMFKVKLDSKGTLAALCYLPTRLQSLVEFYHTEIPVHYRQMGLGDILVNHAFQWAEQMGLLVIPSCTFVKRYLQHHDEHRDLLVRNEQEGITRLVFNHQSGAATVVADASLSLSSSSFSYSSSLSS